MPRLVRVLACRVSGERLDSLTAQIGCYTVGVLVLIIGLGALPRFAATRFEVFLGTVAVATMSLVCVLFGLVLGLLLTHENPRG